MDSIHGNYEKYNDERGFGLQGKAAKPSDDMSSELTVAHLSANSTSPLLFIFSDGTGTQWILQYNLENKFSNNFISYFIT